MAGARRQSTSKGPPQTATPSAIPTPILRPTIPPPPTSKLKIHSLLEVYEATISSLIGTLSEDPFRPESMNDIAKRLVRCERDLEEALEEGTCSARMNTESSETTSREYPQNTRATTTKHGVIKTVLVESDVSLRSADITLLTSRFKSRYY